MKGDFKTEIDHQEPVKTIQFTNIIFLFLFSVQEEQLSLFSTNSISGEICFIDNQTHIFQTAPRNNPGNGRSSGVPAPVTSMGSNSRIGTGGLRHFSAANTSSRAPEDVIPHQFRERTVPWERVLSAAIILRVSYSTFHVFCKKFTTVV